MNTEVYDYFETDEAIFIQRASYSDVGTKIGLPMFVRDAGGKYVINDKTYKKWDVNGQPCPTLKKAILRANLGGDVYQIPEGTIKEVFRHRELTLTGEAEGIADIISSCIGFPISMVGSALLGSRVSKSDLDFLVYGTGAYETVKDQWDEILQKIGAVPQSNSDIKDKVASYNRRFKLDSKDLFDIFLRRNCKFNVNGSEVSLMFTYGGDENPPPHPYSTSLDGDRVSLDTVVTDARHSVMMPRRYICGDTTIWSFRWIDRGFVVENEKVTVQGTDIGDGNIILLSDDDYILPKTG